MRDLDLAIAQFIAAHNKNPKPFVWIKNADQILESLRRYTAETVRILADQLCKNSRTQEISSTNHTRKPGDLYQTKMVGVEGFEPPTNSV